MYEKWQKKTNKSIGRVGVFDDVTTEDNATNTVAPLNADGSIISGRTTKKNAAKRMRAAGAFDVGSGGGGESRGKNSTSELKTEDQVRKKREADKKNKLKNMKRSDKARLNKKRAEERNQKISNALEQNKGWQGKKGYSGRYGVAIKGKR